MLEPVFEKLFEKTPPEKRDLLFVRLCFGGATVFYSGMTIIATNAAMEFAAINSTISAKICMTVGILTTQLAGYMAKSFSTAEKEVASLQRKRAGAPRNTRRRFPDSTP